MKFDLGEDETTPQNHTQSLKHNFPRPKHELNSEEREKLKNSKKLQYLRKMKNNLNNYLIFCEKGVFNCSNVEIKTEINGIFAYIKDPDNSTVFEVPSDKFEIYFNTRKNLAYVIDLTN